MEVTVVWGEATCSKVGRVIYATCVMEVTLISVRALVACSTARAIIPPNHPQHGLQTPCGGDCDECLALAGPSLRPRQPRHARAAAS
eukprot:4939599-Pyramimonas_sp.AAC.1